MSESAQWCTALESVITEMDLSSSDFYLAGRRLVIDVVEQRLRQGGAIAERVFVNGFERSRV